MKYLITATAIFFSSASFAEGNLFDFPRKVECGNEREVAQFLKEEYGEEIALQGSSMNTAGKHTAVMFMTLNAKTGTYSVINYYDDGKLACIIDSGRLVQKKPEEKKQVPRSKML